MLRQTNNQSSPIHPADYVLQMRLALMAIVAHLTLTYHEINKLDGGHEQDDILAQFARTVQRTVDLADVCRRGGAALDADTQNLLDELRDDLTHWSGETAS